jgi:hypothetical protein
MSDDKKLLIVAHQPLSKHPLTLVQTTLQCAGTEDGVEVRLIAPLEANADDVLWADAIILDTTENFSYLSGALNDFSTGLIIPAWTGLMPYLMRYTIAPVSTALEPKGL